MGTFDSDEGTKRHREAAPASIPLQRRSQTSSQARRGLASTGLFALLAESVPSIVIATRSDGTVEYLNEHARAYAGIDGAPASRGPESTLATGPRFGDRLGGVDFIHPDDAPKTRSLWQTALASGQPFESSVRLRRRDGVYRIHRYRATPYHPHATVVDADDDVSGWLVTCSDIDICERTENELRRISSLLAAVSNATSDAIFVKDPHGRYLYVNPSCASLFGCEPLDMVGKTDDELMPPAEAHATQAYDASILEGGVPRTHEEVLTMPHGVRVFSTTKAPFRTTDGDVHGIIGIARDITEQKAADVAARLERDRFAAIADVAPGALYTFHLGPDGTPSLPFATKHIEAIFGVSPVDPRTDAATIMSMGHPDDKPRVWEAIEESARNLSLFSVEYRVITPKRGERWIELRSMPVAAADGGITWHGFISDVTERRSAEHALRIERDRLQSSQAALRSVLEAAPDVIISLDRDYRIQFINHVYPPMTHEQVIGSHALDYLAPESQNDMREAITRVFQTGEMQFYAARAMGANGEVSWYETRVGPVISQSGEVTGVTLCSSDVSSRKRVESALMASEMRYRSIMDVMPDGIFIQRDGRFTFCSPAMARLLGASDPSEIVGTDIFAIFPPEDHAEIRGRMARIIATGYAPPTERVLLQRDGSKRRVRITATTIVDQGKPSFLVIAQDLTDVKRAEDLLRSVLESVTDGIVTLSPVGTILSVNPAIKRLFGYDTTEILNNELDRLLADPSILHAHKGASGRDSDSGTFASLISLVGGDRELVGKRKDGSTFPIELSVASFQRDGTTRFTVVIRDITERKRLEEQFRQAHKMEAFGQLAGGVAHDFNNILTVILGECDLLVSDLPPDDPSLASLSEIYDAGQRAAALTRQLLAFSRRTVLEPKHVDVNAVIRETKNMLGRLIGEDIALVTKLTPNVSQVFVDPGQLSQVILNLAVNARDAMPKGGELRITTSNVRMPPSTATDASTAPPAAGVVPPTSYVLISVRDTGEGMSDDTRSKVFQPFFTTKGVGKGTGLGLAVVHGIVTQSGGRIDLESKPGDGTKFDIYLPAVAEETGQAHGRGDRTGPNQTPEEIPAGTETVLLVEDEEPVRRLAERALSNRGYRVLTAPEGKEALKVLEAHDGSVDIVVTDVVMPGMDGGHLGEIIGQRFARTRVLYTSGYTDDMLVRRGLQSDDVAFLAKPYSPTSLVMAVRATLDKTSEPRS